MSARQNLKGNNPFLNNAANWIYVLTPKFFYLVFYQYLLPLCSKMFEMFRINILKIAKLTADLFFNFNNNNIIYIIPMTFVNYIKFMYKLFYFQPLVWISITAFCITFNCICYKYFSFLLIIWFHLLYELHVLHL